MAKAPQDERYSEEEAARRRDEVVKRMLNTPPQPRKTPAGKKQAPSRKGKARGD
jgi:hypothetical protein